MASGKGRRAAKVLVLGLILTLLAGYVAARFLDPWDPGPRRSATVIAIQSGAGEVDGPRRVTLRLEDGREVTLTDEGRAPLLEGAAVLVEQQTTRFSGMIRFVLVRP